MAGMDAVAVLENLGLKVVYQGFGKVKYQSLRKGQKIRKGKTIVLKLSS
jgi:cell division protein FtsI (penicillin-binding protein 3)